MSGVEAAVDAALAAARNGCWCELYRKPCEYHGALGEGAELALRVAREASTEDLASWLYVGDEPVEERA